MSEEGKKRQPGLSRDDWTYHGVGSVRSADGRPRILVEHTVFGRDGDGSSVLRELPAPDYGGYAWGYDGGGPARAAAAILADALDLGSAEGMGLQPGQSVDTLGQLRRDFCWDVLTQVTDEWRLRRGAVLRWVRGWYAEKGITDIPAAAVHLPPAHPYQDDPA